jgi:hypothetical protein
MPRGSYARRVGATSPVLDARVDASWRERRARVEPDADTLALIRLWLIEDARHWSSVSDDAVILMGAIDPLDDPNGWRMERASYTFRRATDEILKLRRVYLAAGGRAASWPF